MLGFQNIEDRTRHGPHPKDMDFPYPSFLSPPLPFPLHPLSSLLFSSSPTSFCYRPVPLMHIRCTPTNVCTCTRSPYCTTKGVQQPAVQH